jgi:tetratricopeptide (TPR) repeat protein
MTAFDQRHQQVESQINIAIEAAETAAMSLHQLPAPPLDFTGREEELEELHEALKAHRGAAICGLRGMGGIGKTALALKLAQDLDPDYPDAQFFLDLKGTTQPLTPAEALAYVVRAYHPTARLPDSEGELAGLYRSALHDQRALLLMDNAASREQVEPLIPPPGCLLLVTSRQHFTLPGLVARNLDTLPPGDAQALLLRIADRIGECAEEMTELCGYLPLALRLAGSALAERIDLSPAEYLEKLAEAQTRLDLVEASLDLSYQLLDPDLRRLWRLLAVFPATFERQAAGAVWEFETEPTQDALSQLVRYSLVAWDPAVGRYRLHDLARLFAQARLEGDEPVLAARGHAIHYERVARAADELYKQGGEAVLRGLAVFDLEWANIRVGQAWAVAHMEREEAAARLCSAYPDSGAYCLRLRQHPEEQIAWLEAALAAARRLEDRSAEGKYLGMLGLAHRDLGLTEQAIEYYEQALAISREIRAASTKGSPEWTEGRRIEGSDLGGLGSVYRALGLTEQAIEYLEQALAIAREICAASTKGSPEWTAGRRKEGVWLAELGNAYYSPGQVERAIEYYQQALAVSSEIGDRRNEGTWLGNLGLAYSDLGLTEQAIEYYQQALAITREIGDRRGEGHHLGNLGVAYRDLGQVEQARACLEGALAIFEEIKSPSYAEWARNQLAQFDDEWG